MNTTLENRADTKQIPTNWEGLTVTHDKSKNHITFSASYENGRLPQYGQAAIGLGLFLENLGYMNKNLKAVDGILSGTYIPANQKRYN